MSEEVVLQQANIGQAAHIEALIKLPKIMEKKWGKLFYLQLELFCLQLSFFAYSPLRRSLDALSHCKQKSSNC